MIGAKQLDPVLGLDVHLFIIPPAPAPIPIPMPHIGVVCDPFDFIPFFSTVAVNGMPRATAGSNGYSIPHPIPGAPVPLPPSNDHELLTGSLTVNADGEPLSRLGDLVMSCWSIGSISIPRLKIHTKAKNLLMPTSVLLSVPMGPPVLVGGAPMVSLFTLGMKAIGPLLKGLRKLFPRLDKLLKKAASRLDDLMKKVSNFLRKKADDILAAISSKTGRNLDNLWRKTSDAVCWLTGHPVDVASGRLTTDAVDIDLPGPIPFQLRREWHSTSDFVGDFGHGWHHSYELALHMDREAVVARLADGRYAVFAHPGPGRPTSNDAEGLTLHRDGSGWWIETLDGLRYHFGGAALRRLDLPSDGADPVTLPLTHVADPNGNRIRFDRDAQGRLTAIEDSAGRLLTVTTDDNGRVQAIFGPDPERRARRLLLAGYRYDRQGNLVEVVDPADAPFRYVWRDHLLVEEVDRQGTSFYFEYEGTGRTSRCVRTWGSGGVLPRTLRYDLEERRTVVDEARGQAIYRWTEDGVVTERIDPSGACWRTVYDENLRVIEQIDPLGNRVRQVWDNQGRLVEETAADGGTSRWEWDEAGNLVAQTDAVGARWTYTWDERRNLIEARDPEGGTWRFESDQRGRRVRSVDPLGRSTQFGWDEEGNLHMRVDRTGAETRFRHDAYGRVTRRIEPVGTTWLEWDSVGNLVQVTDASDRRFRYRYDDAGNLLAATDPLGRTRSFTYGPFGRLTSAREPSGARRSYAYDLELDLVAVTDPADRRWTVERDCAGRVVAETSYDGRRTTYARDAAGRVLERRLPSGARLAFAYDAAGRLTETRLGADRTERFVYDTAGRLVEAINSDVVVRRSYDALGRLVCESFDDDEVRSFWDAAGNRVRRTAAGRELDFAHDAEGRLAELKAEGHTLLRMRYDGLGREVRRELASGAVTNRQYLPTGELHSSRTERHGERLVTRDYLYNRAGEVTSVTRGAFGTTTYTHDADGRLTSASYPDHAVERFVTDIAGDVPGVPGAPVGTDGAWRAEVDGWHLVYNPDGNLVERANGAVSWRFTYDEDGRLLQARRGPGMMPRAGVWGAAAPDPTLSVEFVYDALRRRVSKVVHADGTEETTRFLWDGDTPVAERGARHDRSFVYRGWEPLLTLERGGSALAIECDQVGAPTAALDAQGDVVWELETSAWGARRRVFGEPDRVPQRFPGQWEDDTVDDLCLSRFRNYSPALRRFDRPDPLAPLTDDGTWSYVRSPLTWVDPFGLAGAKYKRKPGVNSKGKTYQTYTKKNSVTGEVYTGRTSGYGTPLENIANRDARHHKTADGFGAAVLDKSSTNPKAIRGREQQLIDANGGAKSTGGSSGNAINGISSNNPNRGEYLDAANSEFGD